MTVLMNMKTTVVWADDDEVGVHLEVGMMVRG